jgi:hypothetical protein
LNYVKEYSVQNNFISDIAQNEANGAAAQEVSAAMDLLFLVAEVLAGQDLLFLVAAGVAAQEVSAAQGLLYLVLVDNVPHR